MKINFLVTECTFLRYFLPLIVEAKNLGIDSCVFVGRTGKYSCAQSQKNFERILFLSNNFGFKIAHINESYKVKGEPIFCIEGCGVEKEHKQNNNKIFSITYMTDFSVSFNDYIEKVDHVIFPSLKFAEYYDCLNDKNLYLGSPKFEHCFHQDKSKIFKKFGLNDSEKVVTYISPKNRDKNKVDQTRIVEKLKNAGFFVFCKARRKDMVWQPSIFDRVIYDDNWFPHASLELINISEFVVNFDSTAIKESILLRKPILNFNVKPSNVKRLNFLYEYDFCYNFNIGDDIEKIDDLIFEMTKKDHAKDFEQCIKQNLFKVEGTCRRILKAANL